MAETKQDNESVAKRKEESSQPSADELSRLEDLLKDGDYILRKGLIPPFKKDEKRKE